MQRQRHKRSRQANFNTAIGVNATLGKVTCWYGTAIQISRWPSVLAGNAVGCFNRPLALCDGRQMLDGQADIAIV